ncbi:MAG TPA: UDP-N-acetylmuramate--L-alanine ligase, partial [Spirochaetota bacterium]|nr:UDP-N-acetylmuramate--L-alanine ligase [Spirochaetota bacterium]
AFADADELFLTEIYPAGEEPIEGVSSALIRDSIRKHDTREVRIIGRFEEIAPTLAAAAREGDIVLTLGAGDIHKAGRQIVEALGAR